MAEKRPQRIGILTAGGDCPGLNAAIRGVGKAAIGCYDMEVIGIFDGFSGLIENRWRELTWSDLSGILSVGGTFLRTSRDKPHKYEQDDGSTADMTEVAWRNYQQMGLDCLVCIGGGGTQKNAHRLQKKTGMNIITLPKTIDNDVPGTDICFGYDTAVSIATEAVDRLHSTADSHRRVMVLELMGNKVGWIALAAGIAGGADVILIPEIPYDIEVVAESIRKRDHMGKRFSIVAVAEGAQPDRESTEHPTPDAADETHHVATRVARRIEAMTGIESRVTVLGYVQRGGSPTATDRMLATRLGAAAARLIAEGTFGVMVAARGESWEAVPLKEVAGEPRTVPLDHDLVISARLIGTCLGNR